MLTDIKRYDREPQMTTTLTVTYEVPNLTELAAKYAPLTSAATPKEYETVRLGIAELRQLRVAIEKRRVELKADALKYGREVDRIAHELTSQIEAIETPLKAIKAHVDEEKARAKEAARAAEEARQREALAAERAALEAERQRLADEAAEREELARERAELEAARMARQEAALEAERQRLANEREALEADRAQVMKAMPMPAPEVMPTPPAVVEPAPPPAALSTDAVSASVVVPSLSQTDIEKVRAFAARIRAVNETYPDVKSQVARDLVSLTLHELEQVALALDEIKP